MPRVVGKGTTTLVKIPDNRFLYFAFGSNLYSHRVRLNNPSAEFVAVGRIQGYRLGFIEYAGGWKGGVATIISSKGSTVWGVIWSLLNADRSSLDSQEGLYNPIYVDVTAKLRVGQEEVVRCLTYQYPEPFEETLPSVHYKNTIIAGAIEHKLPAAYIEQLRKLPDNGYDGPIPIRVPGVNA
ncbi:unnamed protein product [Cyprideis torosa]|uniref:gamma-glutamylcyclotransferase n=1 Tax=Cyprideis torosa TaxID=163714 RepID=A0A7R8ZMQ3_9CRUS|nr:unnamed protein product [Cyprideis torosa]CAG0896188.1 unnamed protein product [Cyprideis torosa]